MHIYAAMIQYEADCCRTLQSVVNSLEDQNHAAKQGGWPLNDGSKITDPKLVGFETYRMTGVGIGLDFIWGGDMRESDGYVYPSWGKSCSSVQLHVRARLIPGWQSLGSEVHYADQTVGSSTYHNTNDYPEKQKSRIQTSDGTFRPSFEEMTYHDRCECRPSIYVSSGQNQAVNCF